MTATRTDTGIDEGRETASGDWSVTRPAWQMSLATGSGWLDLSCARRTCAAVDPNRLRRPKIRRDHFRAGSGPHPRRRRLGGCPRAPAPRRARRPARRGGRPGRGGTGRRRRRSRVLAGDRGGRRRHHPHPGAGQGLRHPDLRGERQVRPGDRDARDHRRLLVARGPRRAPGPAVRRRRDRGLRRRGRTRGRHPARGGPIDTLPSVVGAAAGIATLYTLLAALLAPLTATAEDAAPAAASDTHADERVVGRLREVLGSGDRKGVDLDRRRFFLTSGVCPGGAAVAGVGGSLLLRHFAVAGDRAALALPTPSSGAAA